MKTFLILAFIAFASLYLYVVLTDVFGNLSVFITIPSIVMLYCLFHAKQLRAVSLGEVEND